ncbi:hypothetical protein NDU88_002282 [Pleurodeles waltl]|uniref:Uncharacterized protein n=1 Tax=Pleurodeles waltl TaxID=8319 RepID=A0AAV7NLK2_PLEWA|nr:hypothetical protein NDU88_002282 [Pleurodeles waltl]
MRGAPCGGHLELWRRRKVPGLPGRRGWRASMRRSAGSQSRITQWRCWRRCRGLSEWTCCRRDCAVVAARASGSHFEISQRECSGGGKGALLRLFGCVGGWGPLLIAHDRARWVSLCHGEA